MHNLKKYLATKECIAYDAKIFACFYWYKDCYITEFKDRFNYDNDMVWC